MSKAPTILILEDETTLLECTKLLLKDLPYKIASAPNGKEALQYLRNNPETVSLILTDINMPSMDGLEFLSVIKLDPILKKIPVILQSAATNEEIQRGLDMGADLYLVKPYTRVDLFTAIIKVLVKQLQQRDLVIEILS